MLQNLTYVTSNTNGSYRELPERAVLCEIIFRMVPWFVGPKPSGKKLARSERAYDNVSWTCMGEGDISQILWEFHVGRRRK